MHILLGSHGVGKTTLLNTYRQYTPNPIYVSDGFSRPCLSYIESHLPQHKATQVEHDMITHFTKWYWEQNISQQNIICTRSIIDSIIYSKVFGYSETIDKYKLHELFERDKSKLQGVFYIPIEFEIENDGVRYTSPDVQKMIDIAIQEFCAENLLTVIEVSGDLEERVSVLRSGIDLFSDKHQ